MKQARFLKISAMLLPVMMAGCAPHSITENPQPFIQGPASYSDTSAAGTSSLQTPGTPAQAPSFWYETFKDEKLSALIENALSNNLDVRQAMARLKQAQAVTTQNEASLFPSVNAEGTSSKRRSDGESEQGESSIGVALSWEIDAFGRLSSAATTSRFQERAAAEDVEAVRLSLTAEVAESYFYAVAQQQQIKLLENQTDLDNQLLGLIDERFQAGIGTNVEVLQQKSQLAENQSLIPPAQATLRIYENRLDVLAATPPDGADKTTGEDIFAKIGTLPAIGVPSDLLLNRPDLRALQNRLVAQDAAIGQAIADRLPRITLDGSHMLTDGTISPVTSLLASLIQPLLDWGRRRAEVARNEALYEEQIAAFTQAYLEAMEDVENALYQENRQREFIERLDMRRSILDQTLDAAEATYRQGESDYLPVLNSIQDLRAVERALVVERRNLVLYRIQLFRAVGGPIAPSFVDAAAPETAEATP